MTRLVFLHKERDKTKVCIYEEKYYQIEMIVQTQTEKSVNESMNVV